MTSFGVTTPARISTSLTSGLPDIDRLLDDGYTPSDETRLNRVKFDAAVELNRRSTPAEVVEQRKAPRYSLREVNALDDDAIRKRLSQLDEDAEKPGWVKFLDLIDAPRNFIASNVLSQFVPEAKRAAMDRGDFDQFGQVKVYGSDILKAMGVENRVVRAVGGFFADVVTDPLSWIGGPLGGLKTAGSKGAVQISNTGRRALRTGIKAVRQGREVADDLTRQMFDATIRDGVETFARTAGKEGLDPAADVVRQAEYLSQRLLGSQGKASKAAERIGLGGSTKGGAIAEDTFRATKIGGNAQDVAAVQRTESEIARIEAVKKWVAANTNNKGIDLSKGAGGAEVAHIPFTSYTLTTPAFSIPILPQAKNVPGSGVAINFGRQAVMQKAFALAGEGNIEAGRAFVQAYGDAQEAVRVSDQMQKLADERVAVQRAADAEAASGGVTEATRARLNTLDDEIDDLAATMRPRSKAAVGDKIVIDPSRVNDPVLQERLAAVAGDGPIEVTQTAGKTNRPVVGGVTIPHKAYTIAEVNTDVNPLGYYFGPDGRLIERLGRLDATTAEGITNVADLAALSELHDVARAAARDAAAAQEWVDASELLSRPTRGDVKAAREWKQAMAKEAGDLLQLDMAEQSVDDVLSAARQNAAMAEMIAERERNAGVRLQNLIGLSEADLDVADKVADAFHLRVETAKELASIRKHDVTRVLDSDSRLLADAAAMALGMSSRQNAVPLMTRIGVFLGDNMNMPDAAERVITMGEWIGKNFGGREGGYYSQLMQAARTAATDGARADANRVADDFVRGKGVFEGTGGLQGLVGEHKHLYADIADYVTLRLEQMLRSANPLMEPFKIDMTPGSAGSVLVQRLTEAGLMQDEAFRAGADELATRMAAHFREIGEDAVRRGDIGNLLTEYIPAQLTPTAATMLTRASRQSGSEMTRRFAGTIMDVSEPRLTHAVEFVDLDNRQRQFLILDAITVGRVSDDDLARWTARGEIAEAEANAMREQRDAINDFFELVGARTDEEKMAAMRARARPLLPFELNELAARGHFDAMVGGTLARQGQMWQTNAMSLLHTRTMAAREQEAIAAAKEIIEPHVILRADPRELANTKGFTATTATGQKIYRIAPNRFMVGGQTYRMIEDGAIKSESLFVPQMVYGDDASAMLIPDALATGIERLNDVTTPANMPKILQAANYATGLFKVYTLTHPSWPITNAIGGVILTAMRLPEILQPGNTKAYYGAMKDALKLAIRSMSGERYFADMGTIDIGGRFVPVRQILSEMEAGRVMNGGQAGEAQRQLMDRLISSRPLDGAVRPGFVGGIRDRMGRYMAEYAALRGSLEPPTKAVERMTQLRAGAKAVKTGAFDRVLGAWFTANGAIDDLFRGAMYLYLRRQGFDPVSAADDVRRSMLNFGDMSSVERNYIRPMVPFYAWTRASLPNMLLRTVRDPKQIAAVPKMTEALETLLADEERVPRHKRPRWIQETLAIQVGKDKTLQLGTMLPQEGAAQAVSGVLGAVGIADFDGQNFLDAMNWLGGQAGPAVKIPLELASGRETFTGRTIGAGEGDGDITLNGYLANQVRWLREFGIGSPGPGPVQRAFDESVGAGVTRLAIGGRFAQNLDEESRQMGLRFQLKEREAELRKAISRADRRGDQESATRLRTDLLEAYALHLQRGGDPNDLPRWAVNDLTELGVTP